MSAVSDREKQFTDQFNALLGSKINRNLGPRTYREPSELELAYINRLVEKGRAAQKESIKRTAEALRPNSKSGSGSKSGSKSKRDLTPDEKNIMQKQLLKNSGVKGGEKKGFWEKVGATALSGLDLISRPSATISGYAKHGIEALNQGEPIWSIGDDLLYGARRGITGKEHAGFGDVIAESKKRTPQGYHDPFSGLVARAMGSNPIKGPLSGVTQDTPLDLQEKILPKRVNKEITKWQDRAGGLAGDIATDPLTYFSFGGSTALEAARQTGKEAVKTATQQAVTSGLKKTLRAKHTGAVNKRMQEVVDRVVREVGRGPSKGKLLGGRKTYNTVGREAGQAIRDEIVTGPMQKLTKFIDDVKAGHPWTQQQINYARGVAKSWKGIPMVKTIEHEYFDEAYKAYHAAITAGKSMDDAALAARRTIEKLAQDEADNLSAHVVKSLSDNLEKKISLKFAGREVKEIPKLGKFLDKAAIRLEDTPLGRMRYGMSHAAQNPGVGGVVASKTHSQIVHEASLFEKKLLAIRETLSPGDEEILTHMLEGTTPGPAHLQPIKDEIRKLYDEIGADKGLIPTHKDYAPNFTYQRLKKLGKESSKWRDLRKPALKQARGQEYSTEKAIQKGLRPHTRALDNLYAYKVKSLQQGAPKRLAKMLGDSYAVKMTLPSDSVARDRFLAERNLVKIPKGEVPDSMVAHSVAGGDVVMDEDLYNMVRRYKEMVKPGSIENRDMTRVYDFLLGKFKKMATIYRPGFHVKNVISDAFLGSMDGIGVGDYRKVWGVLEGKAGKGTTQAIGTHTWDDLAEEFRQNLSSGFISQEGLGTSKIGGRVSSKVQHLSERREDWGRFAHFYGAMKDEYQAALAKGLSQDQAWKEAIDTSVYRVNKYKFDYAALTKGEAKIARRVVPFYTFSRKIIPLLAESSFISPRNLSIANRVMTQSKSKLSDDTPDWLKAGGFSPLGGLGGDNPWGVAIGQTLPINNLTELADNPLASMAPGLTLPFDLATGHDVFSHKKISGDSAPAQFFDALKNKLPPVQQYRQLFPQRHTNEDTGESSITPILQRAANMLGVPLRQVTPAQQDQQLQAMISNLSNKVKRIDAKLKDHGYTVYYSERSDGVNLRLKNIETGEILGEFDSIQELQRAVGKVTG